MNNTTNRLPMKVCNRCEWNLPNDLNHYRKEKLGKDGLKTICKQCETEKRLKNREKKRAYDKLYRINNRENKEAYFIKWKKENREKYLEGKKRYNKENAHRQKVWHKNWKENNPERMNELSLMSVHKRRSRKRELPDHLTHSDWEEALKAFDYKCAYCSSVEKIEREHFIALNRGGEYTKDNIIPACLKCNRNKSDKDFFEWYPETENYSMERVNKILKYLGYKNNTQQLTLL